MNRFRIRARLLTGLAGGMIVFGAILAAEPLAPTVTAPAAPPTAEAALTRVSRPPWARDPFPTREELAEARRVLEAAAAREPAVTKWSFGIAQVSRLETAYATGEAAAAKRKETKELFAKLAAREPGSADYQYWLGNTCFEMIDDVGLLSKPSLASTGRGAFGHALAIDPSHVAARYALGVFYSQAPGVVGGSTAKAKAQGEMLLKLPDGRGEFFGRILLAEIAAEGKEWDEMSRQYAAAETAKGEGANAATALQSHAAKLLLEKKDPAAVLSLLARPRTVAPSSDTTLDFFEGEAHRQRGEWAPAAAAFEKVLAKNAEARNTRFGIAECYEHLGNRAEARKQYEEFARRFPKDERASKAREAAKRLS